jgi:O-Antigen ligase
VSAETTASGPGGSAGRGRPRRRRIGVALGLAWLGLATLGFNTTRAGGLAISDLLFVACGCVVAVKLLTGRDADLASRPMRKTSPLIYVGSLLMLTAGTLSAFTAWDGFLSMQVVARFAWLTLIWFWLLRAVTRDRDALAVVGGGWRLAVLITAVLGAAGELGIIHVGVENVEGRQTAFFGQPNEYAIFLGIALPLFVFDTPDPRGGSGDRRPMALRLGLVGLLAFAIATSGSLTATFSCMVGLAAAGVLMLFTHRRTSRRRRSPLGPMLGAVVAAIGLFLLSTSDLSVVERFTRYQEGDSGLEDSVQTREDRNEQAIELLPETLVVGTGLQLQGDAGDRARAITGVNPKAVLGIHNMYLKTAHEGGVPALVGLLIIMIAVFNQVFRLSFNTRGTELHRLSVALFGALVTGATQAMFHPLAYQRYFWMGFAFVTCVWAVRRQELRERLAGLA